MNIVGIICEFNPFHNGHKYLIDRVREDLKPDAVVCVMSGNFVQRGIPATWHKRLRAQMAVACGADLVFELPACYSVNAAPEFAYGGTALLASLGVNTLAFGSECGDASLILEIARKIASESDEMSLKIKSLMNGGMAYPKAYSELLEAEYPGFLGGSNNVLALEYAKQIIKHGFAMDLYTVKRVGAKHDSSELSGEYSSASAIRNAVLEEVDINNIYESYIPKDACSIIKDYGLVCRPENQLFAILRHRILTMSCAELAQTLEVSEGLENKLKQAILKSNSVDELVHRIKSKRYTYARISRILMQILLGITKENYPVLKDSSLKYARVLAANAQGTKLIKRIKKADNIEIITNTARQKAQNAENNPSLALDIVANDIYSVLNNGEIYKLSDYVCSASIIGVK